MKTVKFGQKSSYLKWLFIKYREKTVFEGLNFGGFANCQFYSK